VIIIGMAGFALPLYLYIPATGLLLALLLLLAGFFGGIPHTIIVLMVQSLFPGRRALASGLALGLMFSAGAIGSYVLGVVADNIGLGLALQYTAVLPLIALIAALFLPKKNINI
jgi:predicted MFS family arabinose efflux permease